ncbi:class I SAM-dependent methyltransferase [Eubacterium oxidoreducens]|uniref:Methyltransferase domain-containing protein n=1 Tax=Eubacterium oxidoreducens TaxID=1732 RepID=A0A1G6CIR7_EUBOX|nr:class I SAM-dependent methyltransferase [Eubacterium oxidoreducens]SDB32741.1 Methyltransferase domain-containing protein [Eubacterium oxidoreducens]
MTNLEEYYNKFNEEKRLNSRHGQIEYRISMDFIHQYLKPGDKIADIGAATGRYSIPLFEEGYDVTAVEPVQHNLGRLQKKCPQITAFKGNALKLKRLADNSFDAVIFFGPMYHLIGHEQKMQALLEAKRITKPGGHIFVAYIMNEYSVITYAFKERHILECMEEGRFDEDFQTVPKPDDLYDYVRLEEINRIKEEAGLLRKTILSPDGAANYMRPFLNQLTQEEFEQFIRYQRSVCERPELLGAGAHIVDILCKE